MSQNQHITYTSSLNQVGFVIIFAFLDNFLLALMDYDHYVAICQLLNYMTVMNPSVCGLLALLSLLLSTLDTLLHSLMLPQLSLCRNMKIPHFFCILTQVIKLACSDTHILYTMIYVTACMFGGIPISGIIFSYIHIVSFVMRMPTLEGKYKAFSTCGSHLSVISLF